MTWTTLPCKVTRPMWISTTLLSRDTLSLRSTLVALAAICCHLQSTKCQLCCLAPARRTLYTCRIIWGIGMVEVQLVSWNKVDLNRNDSWWRGTGALTCLSRTYALEASRVDIKCTSQARTWPVKPCSTKIKLTRADTTFQWAKRDKDQLNTQTREALATCILLWPWNLCTTSQATQYFPTQVKCPDHPGGAERTKQGSSLNKPSKTK